MSALHQSRSAARRRIPWGPIVACAAMLLGLYVVYRGWQTFDQQPKRAATLLAFASALIAAALALVGTLWTAAQTNAAARERAAEADAAAVKRAGEAETAARNRDARFADQAREAELRVARLAAYQALMKSTREYMYASQDLQRLSRGDSRPETEGIKRVERERLAAGRRFGMDLEVAKSVHGGDPCVFAALVLLDEVTAADDTVTTNYNGALDALSDAAAAQLGYLANQLTVPTNTNVESPGEPTPDTSAPRTEPTT